MAQIIKKQTFIRGEDFGGGEITQICEYNSTSEQIKIIIDSNEIYLPTSEWSLLFNLINETLKVKGHNL